MIIKGQTSSEFQSNICNSLAQIIQCDTLASLALLASWASFTARTTASGLLLSAEQLLMLF